MHIIKGDILKQLWYGISFDLVVVSQQKALMYGYGIQ